MASGASCWRYFKAAINCDGQLLCEHFSNMLHTALWLLPFLVGISAQKDFCDIIYGKETGHEICGEHGKCIATQDTASCLCEPNYTGPACNVEFDFDYYCELSIGGKTTNERCLPDGKCISAKNGARCMCPENFSGDLCEEKLDSVNTANLNSSDKLIIFSLQDHDFPLVHQEPIHTYSQYLLSEENCLIADESTRFENPFSDSTFYTTLAVLYRSRDWGSDYRHTVATVGGKHLTNKSVEDSIHLYSLENNSWSFSVGKLETARYSSSATFAHDFLLICGGEDRDNKVLDSCEDFLFTGSTLVAQVPSGIESLQEARASASSTHLSFHFYLIGGYGATEKAPGGGIPAKVLKSVERVKFGGAWNLVSPMSTARFAAAATGLQTSIIVCGGMNEQLETLDSCERYWPEQDRWSNIASMSNSRSHFAINVVNDLMYVLGGKSTDVGAKSYLDGNGTVWVGNDRKVEHWKEGEDKWTQCEPLMQAGEQHISFVL